MQVRLQLTGPAPPGIANFNVGFPIIPAKPVLKQVPHKKYVTTTTYDVRQKHPLPIYGRAIFILGVFSHFGPMSDFFHISKALFSIILQLTGPTPLGIAHFNDGIPIILSRKELLKHEKNLTWVQSVKKRPKWKLSAHKCAGCFCRTSLWWHIFCGVPVSRPASPEQKLMS